MNANIYHNQADIDEYAKRPDTTPNITTTSMQAIIEAYNEFYNDLMLESQEAY